MTAAAEADEPVVAVDVFCGAGGLSWALAWVCELLDLDVELHAINHWERAIETHKRNHPWANHYHAKIQELDPADIAEPGRPTIFVGGIECTHFSMALGGKPITEQKRMPAAHVLTWIQKLRPRIVLFENVREFEDWGPIEDGEPTRNGEVFEAWRDFIHALGYSVDQRVLNAADYGDATSRRRLFIVARREGRPTWPEPTHSEDGEQPGTKAWRPAADVIDFSDPGESIWTRDVENPRVTPPATKTMRRIAEGIRRHAPARLAPFADALGQLGPSAVEGLRECIVPAEYARVAAEVLDEPFLVRATAPVGTALCVPYLLGQQSGSRPRPITDRPVPTIASRGAIGLVDPEPFVLPRDGYFRGIDSNPAYDPGERPGQRPRVHGIGTPLPTVPASKSPAAVTRPQPFLVNYHGNSATRSVTRPLPTLTTRETLALCLPEHYPWGLDVRFRMLKNSELAAAMGFPQDYEFVGNKGETTKQIGNAVPVNLGTALIEHLLTGEEPTLRTYTDAGDATGTAADSVGDDGIDPGDGVARVVAKMGIDSDAVQIPSPGVARSDDSHQGGEAGTETGTETDTGTGEADD